MFSSQTPNAFIPNAQSRYVISPRIGQSMQVNQNQQYNHQQLEQENTNSNSSEHLHHLTKLYFMMLLCYFIALFNLIEFESMNSFFNQNGYFLYLFLGALLLISMLSLSTENSLLYALFVILFYFLFACIKAVNNMNVALMIIFTFGGQVLAQFLSVLSANNEKDLQLHQQSLYILTSGLIVFQLFITCFDIDFFEMIIILITGFIFGFFLVISTMSNESKFVGNALPESVSIYTKILVQILKKAQQIAFLYYKDPVEVEIKLIERNKKIDENDYKIMNQSDAKNYQHLLINTLNGLDGLIGLSDGTFIYKKGMVQYSNAKFEECTDVAIMRLQ
ncbi:unnamed protein product (macronuclear) [Paramecium tetraurelia]|uniref:Transmembrane protein n=1 Tax=Paramecium tetraurelia TaxID=5888 RepID=A0E9Q9_PARTE|nr:uncharacterized protein GSPATT00024757001 [Paramecium tetraurelia]CAK92026.1 unnamed protein product [Paramecium tetraurelia]|eukprot:XP_001459423.1 hypothetical protein (macronuclear) [Paramecium tetraurelia strain d4-2]